MLKKTAIITVSSQKHLLLYSIFLSFFNIKLNRVYESSESTRGSKPANDEPRKAYEVLKQAIKDQ